LPQGRSDTFDIFNHILTNLEIWSRPSHCVGDLRPNSEIADGVHWIKNGYVNSYVIDNGEDELILIDTGTNKKAKTIMQYIRTDLSDKTPASIFLTHHHLDHMGGLFHLDHHFHPRKFAHAVDAEVITGERSSPASRNLLLRPIMWLALKLIGPPSVQGIELIEDGQEEQGVKVYHLPGHTMGSVGFLKGRTFFSGDAAVSSGESIKVGPAMFAENLNAVYSSFKKLGSVSFEQLLPGHGAPILENADQRIKEAIEKYEL
jgi:glyoxylase-like metal-dependent hydrolase (beta-lactamase superfamily II)